MRLKVKIGALLLMGVFAFAGSAAADDQEAVDSFRRLIFMVNLDPVPWEQVPGELTSIGEFLSGESETIGTRFVAKYENLMDRLYRESTISVRTPMMQMQTGKALVESGATAFVDLMLERLDAGANPTSLGDLWNSVEPEVAWGDAEVAQRFNSLFNSEGNASPDAEALSEVREYLSENFHGEFHIVYHGALRPVPVSGHGKGLGPVPKTGLPPGTVLNPEGASVLADLKAEYGDWRDESLEPFAVGLVAFHDPSIFGEPGRSLGLSCASCHLGARPNAAFFIPGLSNRPGNADVSNSFFSRLNNNKAFDPLDIPGLEGLRHTGPFGRNARFETLAQVVRNVIVREFDNEEPPARLVEGIVAFLEAFEFEGNPELNADGTLAKQASDEVRRGEGIFNRPFEQLESRSCATCHVPGDYFLDRQMHDIGTVPPGSPYAPDGRLDTPTLLGAGRSAPYMHDGRFPTLRSVVEWFDTKYELALSQGDLNALVAYVETVGGGEGTD